MACSGLLWLGRDNIHGAERKDRASSWMALITGGINCGVWPPVDRQNSPVMKFTKYNDKQVSSAPISKEELRNQNPRDSFTLQ